MSKLDLVPGGMRAASVEGFEVAYADDGGEQRLPLLGTWSVAFESCRPVREFPSYKGQRHHSGQWWTATTGTLVGYESWLERDTLVLLDFEADVVGLASQPFWLFWNDANGKSRSHAPDYFARLVDGSARVLDCRPANRIKPRDQAAFDATRAACELMGWGYDVVDTPPSTLLLNLRWLAGYRHPRHDLPEVARVLRAVFTKPFELMAGAGVVGDPVAILPVLFHLGWPDGISPNAAAGAATPATPAARSGNCCSTTATSAPGTESGSALISTTTPNPTWTSCPRSSPRSTGTCGCCVASARPPPTTRC